jgi:hypothetical protein
MTSLQPTVDEAHRFIPEYRGECPQAGRYFDSQAAISNGIHALWDRLFGKEAVAALDDHPREAAYFATCSLAMVVALYASRSVLIAVWPDFAKITPRHKQMYVLMNLMKSLLLGAQATSFSWLWYSSKEYGCTLNPLGFNLSCNWSVDAGHHAYLKQISLLYAAVDIVALAVVHKLPLTTKIHHWAVTAWLLWVMTIDFGESPIAQKLMFYGFWSTLAFPVNGFLGLRVTSPGSWWMRPLSRGCFVLYAGCCFCNWSLHLAWGADNAARGVLRWQEVLYLVSLSLLVRDDLILMKWLKNFKPATPEELKKLAARQAQEAAKGAGGQAGRGEAFPVSEGAKKK